MLPITKFSLRAAKSIADHMPFVTDFFVPKAEFQFVEISVRYQPLNSPNDAHRIDGGVP